MAKVRHYERHHRPDRGEEGAEALHRAGNGPDPGGAEEGQRLHARHEGESFDKVFLVTPKGTEDALTEGLFGKARYHFDAELCESLEEAIGLAKGRQPPRLLICGSEAIALEAAAQLENR